MLKYLFDINNNKINRYIHFIKIILYIINKIIYIKFRYIYNNKTG